MNLLLAIGGQEIQIRAPGPVMDLVAQRYGPFAKPSSRPTDTVPIVVEVTGHARTFSSIIERSPRVRVSACSSHELTITGAISARYDLASRSGFIEHARNLGDIDTMLRLVLSVTLPLTGALLIHGAALNNPRFGAMAFLVVATLPSDSSSPFSPSTPIGDPNASPTSVKRPSCRL